MSTQTVLIGVDGADFDLLEPWKEDGKLPFFERLLEQGVHGIPKSTNPGQTCPAVPGSDIGVILKEHSVV